MSDEIHENYRIHDIAKHSSGKGWCPLLDICWRTEEEEEPTPCPRKKLYPCIRKRCHNSGKKRRIFTKFHVNTETLNCKQVTKFQQNRSTSATASLVRSLKSISVHYRHWLIDCQVCVRANGKTSALSTPKV